MYNNDKFHRALDEFLSIECDTTPAAGAIYTKDLMYAFELFVAKTGLMKRSPGPVAIGLRLKELGFTKTLKDGLTYWQPLSLHNPVTRPEDPKAVEARKKRLEVIRKKLITEDPDAEAALVKARMKMETAERNRRGGRLEE